MRGKRGNYGYQRGRRSTTQRHNFRPRNNNFERYVREEEVKKPEVAKEPSFLMEIPEDILTEIFLKMGAKDLLKMTLVCRKFRRIIEYSYQFIRHLALFEDRVVDVAACSILKSFRQRYFPMNRSSKEIVRDFIRSFVIKRNDRGDGAILCIHSLVGVMWKTNLESKIAKSFVFLSDSLEHLYFVTKKEIRSVKKANGEIDGTISIPSDLNGSILQMVIAKDHSILVVLVASSVQVFILFYQKRNGLRFLGKYPVQHTLSTLYPPRLFSNSNHFALCSVDSTKKEVLLSGYDILIEHDDNILVVPIWQNSFVLENTKENAEPVCCGRNYLVFYCCQTKKILLFSIEKGLCDSLPYTRKKDASLLVSLIEDSQGTFYGLLFLEESSLKLFVLDSENKFLEKWDVEVPFRQVHSIHHLSPIHGDQVFILLEKKKHDSNSRENILFSVIMGNGESVWSSEISIFPKENRLYFKGTPYRKDQKSSSIFDDIVNISVVGFHLCVTASKDGRSVLQIFEKTNGRSLMHLT